MTDDPVTKTPETPPTTPPETPPETPPKQPEIVEGKPEIKKDKPDEPTRDVKKEARSIGVGAIVGFIIRLVARR